MCGRYVTPAADSLEREFAVRRGANPLAQNFNAHPGARVPVIRQHAGERQLVAMQWGLLTDEGQPEAGPDRRIHACIETLASGAASQAAWSRGQRCLIPALGFYEWHLLPDGTKQPFFIHVDDQDVFGFAGLWDRSRAGDGTLIESCTIITMPANRLMAGIHNTRSRMPAILTRSTRDLWLAGEGEAAGEALRPYAEERMTAYPVSARVNSVEVNDERLIEPLETDVD